MIKVFRKKVKDFNNFLYITKFNFKFYKYFPRYIKNKNY